VYDLAKDNPSMLTILNAHNSASSHPAETTSEKLESVNAPKQAKRLSKGGAVKTRKKLDDPVSVTETDSEEETGAHGEKQEDTLDEGLDDSAAVASTREVLHFTMSLVSPKLVLVLNGRVQLLSNKGKSL
jgi:hypothetical protein